MLEPNLSLLSRQARTVSFISRGHSLKSVCMGSALLHHEQVLLKVRLVMIFDQETVLHGDRSWIIQCDRASIVRHKRILLRLLSFFGCRGASKPGSTRSQLVPRSLCAQGTFNSSLLHGRYRLSSFSFERSVVVTGWTLSCRNFARSHCFGTGKLFVRFCVQLL